MKKRIWSIVFTVISLMVLCMLPERKTLASNPSVDICGIDLPKNNYMDINYQVGTDKPGNGRYAFFDGSTLTLNNFDASDNGWTVGMDEVTNLVIIGTNNVSSSGYNCVALHSNTDLNISGDGILNVDSSGDFSSGISAQNDITISNGIVNARGKGVGIITAGTLKVFGGTVSAVGTETISAGCEADKGITVTGGTLYATGQTAAAYKFIDSLSVPVKGSLSYNDARVSLGAVTWANTGTSPDPGVYSIVYPNYLIGTMVAKTLYIEAPSQTHGGICDHNYEWIVENEPTEDETGLLVEKCTKCGHIRASQTMPAIKDDYGRLMNERIKQILNAKPGQTINVDLITWSSLPKSFFEAISKNRDITVNIKYMDDHKLYSFKILRGQKIETPDPEPDYYGPELLKLLYDVKEIQTK